MKLTDGIGLKPGYAIAEEAIKDVQTSCGIVQVLLTFTCEENRNRGKYGKEFISVYLYASGARCVYVMH